MSIYSGRFWGINRTNNLYTKIKIHTLLLLSLAISANRFSNNCFIVCPMDPKVQICYFKDSSWTPHDEVYIYSTSGVRLASLFGPEIVNILVVVNVNVYALVQNFPTNTNVIHEASAPPLPQLLSGGNEPISQSILDRQSGNTTCCYLWWLSSNVSN